MKLKRMTREYCKHLLVDETCKDHNNALTISRFINTSKKNLLLLCNGKTITAKILDLPKLLAEMLQGDKAEELWPFVLLYTLNNNRKSRTLTLHWLKVKP